MKNEPPVTLGFSPRFKKWQQSILGSFTLSFLFLTVFSVVLIYYFDRSLVLTAVYLIAVLLIAFWSMMRISKQVEEPVRKLIELCESYSRGDFTKKAPSFAYPFSRLATVLNRMGDRFEENKEKIEKLERMRIDFVANVSHELKTPLTSIHGYTETLLNLPEWETEQIKRFLNKINKNSARLEFLIQDLLELSDIESHFNVNLHQFPVRRLFDKVESFFEEKLRRKKHFLKVLSDNDQMVFADEQRMEQVVVNLVDNAIKYTPEGTQIELLALKDARGRDLIQVADNGPGIEKEHLPRLFERFYRVDKARSRSLGGTGLGLAIVKHLMQAQGGDVQVESEIGKGTTFTIVLPKQSKP